MTVRTGPGQMALTVMPSPATSRVSVRVRPSRPCLLAAQAARTRSPAEVVRASNGRKMLVSRPHAPALRPGVGLCATHANDGRWLDGPRLDLRNGRPSLAFNANGTPLGARHGRLQCGRRAGDYFLKLTSSRWFSGRKSS